MTFHAFYKWNGLEILASVRNGRLYRIVPVLSGRADALAALQEDPGGESSVADDGRVLPLLHAALSWSFERQGAPPEPDFGRASSFRQKVWRALMAIPPGTVESYGMLARRIGRPGAGRAVAQAAAANRLAFVVPCHRLVAAGGMGGYRWGVGLKRRLLAAEGIRRLDSTASSNL